MRLDEPIVSKSIVLPNLRYSCSLRLEVEELKREVEGVDCGKVSKLNESRELLVRRKRFDLLVH